MHLSADLYMIVCPKFSCICNRSSCLYLTLPAVVCYYFFMLRGLLQGLLQGLLNTFVIECVRTWNFSIKGFHLASTLLFISSSN